MTIQEAITKYKEHFYKEGLKDQLIWWQTINEFKGQMDFDSDDQKFIEDMAKINFDEIIIYGRQNTNIHNLAECEPTRFREALYSLFNEDVELILRVREFKKACISLWSSVQAKNPQWKSPDADERLVSAFLTCKYPDKYTFYKGKRYEFLCDLVNENKKQAGEKYEHYLKLLKEKVLPEMMKEAKLIGDINKELSKQGFPNNELLLAQIIIWFSSPETTSKDKETENNIYNQSEINENANESEANGSFKDYTTESDTSFTVVADSNTIKDKFKGSRQVIYYGAPGTGKSYDINKETKKYDYIRTTFHPDSDYAAFIGSYKPVMNGEKITYKFVRQAFTKAYLAAWKKYAVDGDKADPQFLIIEEINRGNCAQIFGDIFQLLDRNDEGFSSYPVESDSELCKDINFAFNDEKTIDGKDGNYRLPKGCKLNIEGQIDGYKGDLSKAVKEGKVLLLPPNLYIWATMNTSDQSLFPIDSAFKRRWDWEYMPIEQPKAKCGEGENEEDPRKWRIMADGNYCYWWEFLVAINKEIEKATDSEDKQLGYFFTKPKDGIYIDAKTFVSKVIFYLWNDVFKDEDSDIFKYKKLEEYWNVDDVAIDGHKLSGESTDIYFRNFFTGKAIINEKLVRWFINNILQTHKSAMLDDKNQDQQEGKFAKMREIKEFDSVSDDNNDEDADNNSSEQPATES